MMVSFVENERCAYPESIVDGPAASADCEAAEIQDGTAAGSRWGYWLAKRAFDIAFSLVVIVLLSWFFLVIAIAISVDSRGGVIHRRWCVGKDGAEFPMYKFRTMRTEPPEEILSPEQYVQWRAECKVDDDPRITRVGKVLRKASLDELPQFFNVLFGSMHVISVRPVTAEEAEMYGILKDELLSMKPGITGYWQAYGRSMTGYSLESARVQMQLHYVRNCSLGLDAKIFFKTIAALFQRTGR